MSKSRTVRHPDEVYVSENWTCPDFRHFMYPYLIIKKVKGIYLVVGSTSLCHNFEGTSLHLSSGPEHVQEVRAGCARGVRGRENVVSWKSDYHLEEIRAWLHKMMGIHSQVFTLGIKEARVALVLLGKALGRFITGQFIPGQFTTGRVITLPCSSLTTLLFLIAVSNP